MSNIIVLGAGMVGSTMAIDLAKKHLVTITDFNEEALEKAIKKCDKLIPEILDVTNKKELQEILKPFDLVICAVPGFLGFETLKSIIEAGKNVIDISFFPENSLELDKLAKQKNVTAIVDCGVAPGMGNIIFGHHNNNMEITDYECLVGGLPVKREWPYEYQAVFSPIDVIEEYIRPARFVQNSQLITKEALSETELIEFDEIGTLESWNSDGLRSLIKTMPHVPNMIEKTLRYPGCVEYLKVLRASGFFSYDKIKVDGHDIRPIDVTSKLLFPKWEMKDGDRDFTIMRIIIKGIENNKSTTYQYNLLDRYENDTISMARTTGFTCTAVANLVLDKILIQKILNR